MIALNVQVQGDKVIIDGLRNFAIAAPLAVQRGLKKAVRGVHREAMEFLNGSGGVGKKSQIVGPSRGFVKKSGESVNFKQQFSGAGAYPVPVRTGNLKRLLDFVDPGQSITSNGKTFSAANMEAVVFDSAQYASVIHQGTGSSAKFGKRAYLDDALANFNQGDGIAKTIETEMMAEIAKRGLA